MLEIVFEIFLEIFGELLLELAIAGAGEYTAHRTKLPVLAAVGAMVFGACLAVFSLWPLPHHLIHSNQARLVGLIFCPLAVGSLLGAKGYFKARPRFLGWSFVNGVMLAATVGLIRYFFAS